MGKNPVTVHTQVRTGGWYSGLLPNGNKTRIGK